MPQTTRKVRALAVLYVAQGICYLMCSLWRVLSGIGFFRAPPGLVLLYNVYLLLVFIASLYFLYLSYSFLRGQRPLKKSNLINSALSAILWILPAIFSFGTANTYRIDPHIPLDIKAH